MSPGTDLTVPQEVELVDAVVHALHVLEDVGPRVWRGTQGGHVARLQTHTPRHRTAIYRGHSAVLHATRRAAFSARTA